MAKRNSSKSSFNSLVKQPYFFAAIILIAVVAVVLMFSAGNGQTAKFSAAAGRQSGYQDNDKDGYFKFSPDKNKIDCDDNDKTVYPGAREVCDGKDNNCDGKVDEGKTRAFYKDSDGDGYGDRNTRVEACSAPQGYVSKSGDCKDGDKTINPGAADVCGNNVDEDCSGADLQCQQQAQCTDTDGGINYAVKGTCAYWNTTTQKQDSFTDHCTDTAHDLIEYHCAIDVTACEVELKYDATLQCTDGALV